MLKLENGRFDWPDHSLSPGPILEAWKKCLRSLHKLCGALVTRSTRGTELQGPHVQGTHFWQASHLCEPGRSRLNLG